MTGYSVETNVIGLVDALSAIRLAPLGDRSPFDVLKALPRTGKAKRIELFKLKCPKRSVFDHIMSLGRNADLVLRLSTRRFSSQFLTNAILFHDLHEVITGDIPEYTPPDIAGNMYRNSNEKNRLECEANAWLENNLPIEIAHSFHVTIAALNNCDADSVKFFHMIDRTDPIIAIWRYINFFGFELPIDDFVAAMTAFFENPGILGACDGEPGMQAIVGVLQNPENAREYARRRDWRPPNLTPDQATVLMSLIQRGKMHFITEEL